MDIKDRDFSDEWVIKATRSSGAGGQHVNKVSTKVELDFHVAHSALLNEEEKELIKQKLSKRINKEGWLKISCQQGRSQLQNKEIAIEKFYELLAASLVKPKIRRATKPSRSSKVKRLEGKKIHAQKKENRRKI